MSRRLALHSRFDFQAGSHELALRQEPIEVTMLWLERTMRWLNPAERHYRLADSEVKRIAQAAATGAGHDGASLRVVQRLIDDQGKLRWSVTTPAIGAVLEAVVDDETGEVFSVERWHGR